MSTFIQYKIVIIFQLLKFKHREHSMCIIFQLKWVDPLETSYVTCRFHTIIKIQNVFYRENVCVQCVEGVAMRFRMSIIINFSKK